MKNNILYKWQRLYDGINEVNELDDLLLEMKQSVINNLQIDIEKAESGKDLEAPFDDIFGTSTPDNIKNRMIIPYDNDDINKMKILMLDIFDKLYKEYTKNPNIKVVRAIEWENKKEIAKQQKKPQGWKEGDPIPVFEKEVGSPIVNVVYISKLGDQKERTIQLSFGKLLQKYFPDQMIWWQGDKSKDISGKQSFFTSNVETTDQIIHEVKFGDEENIREAASTSKNNIIIFSRHPIDVVRMSDFDLLSYSCHAQGGSYFGCAIQEARRSAKGGGVLFLVNKDRFDKAFPDGVIPQTGDLFSDRDRPSVGQLEAKVISRLRVRRVVDEETGTEYAVPDKKVYGKLSDDFRKSTFDYFANTQKQKFIDPETNQPIFPNLSSLLRYGGEYEDSGEYKIGENFIKLMDTAFVQAKILKDIRNDKDYIILNKSLKAFSIAWNGEDEESYDEEDDFCEEYENQIQTAIAAANNRCNYITFSYVNYECTGFEGDREIVVDIIAKIQIEIPINRFSNTNANRSQIEDALREHDFSEMITINTSILWPDLSFEAESIEVNLGGAPLDANNNEDESYIIEFLYKDQITHSGAANIVGRINRYALDFAQFEHQVSYEQFKNEVEAILDQAGLLNVGAASSMKEQISDLIEYVAEEDSPFSYSKSGSNHKFSIYSRPILLKEMSEFKNFDATAEDFNAVANNYNNKFAEIFFNRATQIDDQLKNQIPLFQDIPSQQLNRLKLPKKAVEIYGRAAIEDVGFNSEINNNYRRRLKYSYDFIVTINNNLTEEEALLAIAFVKYISHNIKVLDDIALEAFYKTFSYSLKERKKLAFSKLIKEVAGKNNNCKIKIRK